MATVIVSLPVYDNDGIQVDTTTVMLDDSQVEDIVNCAVQVVYAARKDAIATDHETLVASPDVAELAEALESYNAIEDGDYFPGAA